jgi:hypothetical protein
MRVEKRIRVVCGGKTNVKRESRNISSAFMMWSFERNGVPDVTVEFDCIRKECILLQNNSSF